MKKLQMIFAGLAGSITMLFWNCQRVFATDITKTLTDEDGVVQEGAAKSGGSLNTISDTLDNLGQGGFTIVQKLGVYAIAIVIVILGVRFAVNSGNAAKTSENKSSILPILISAVLIFGVIGLITALKTIGGGLFPTTTTTGSILF